MSAGASRATVPAVGGGDVIVAIAATVASVVNVVNAVRGDVENIWAAAGGARGARGEDVVTGIEAKDVEVAVRSFRRVRDTC